ncbi:myotubularin-related protein 10-B-like [Heptranchias perlo]|uniref:myotubularin-related protein 10-B-like n=1 Tax=Heptranchias perlo TaxID=212740 RepID=UPI00355A8BAC
MFQSGSLRLQPRRSDGVKSFYEMSDLIVGVKLLPGEKVKGEATSVRKCDSCRKLRKSIAGKLLCTNFRVIFVPVETRISEVPCDRTVLLGENDVALTCIDRVVAVTSSRTKVLTASSSLKFHPQQLLVYCKDFRLLHFQFEQDSRAREIIPLIAQSCQPASPRELFVFDFALEMSRSSDPRLVNANQEEDVYPTRMFESLSDWESEIVRTGALGWRVSLVNERFEVSASLSKVLVVPQKILDLDIKKACAHFNEGRIPRWQWRHPGGSDLLRMGNFQSNTCAQRDGVSKLEDLLYGAQSKLVIADLADELPTPPEIQLAYNKLKNLCTYEFPTSFRDSDEKWLSTLEGTHWLEYVRLCLNKASEISALLTNQCLTVALQETDDRDLSCLVSSLIQVMLDPLCRTIVGFQSLVQKEWLGAGHRFSDRFNHLRTTDKDESPVFLLFLDCVWQLLDRYPVSFEFTDTYLMAIHDSTRLLLFGTFLFNCQRERARNQQVLSADPKIQSTHFSNGWQLPRGSERDEQVVLKGGFFKWEERSCPLPSVWDWSLQFGAEHQVLFRSALYGADPQFPVQNGASQHCAADKADCCPLRSVLVLTKGGLMAPAQLLPWRNVSVSRRLTKWSQSLDSLLEIEQPLKSPAGPSLDPAHLPLPPIPGPRICLWKGCYLRWVEEGGIPQGGPEAAYSRLSTLSAEIHSLRQRLHQEADRRNAAPNGLDHQGNRIPPRNSPRDPPPACRSETSTMEMAFSKFLSSAMR